MQMASRTNTLRRGQYLRALTAYADPPALLVGYYFLDTDREMIFDGSSGLSWGLIGEGGNGFWSAVGTEETIKEPSFSSMETDIPPFFHKRKTYRKYTALLWWVTAYGHENIETC